MTDILFNTLLNGTTATTIFDKEKKIDLNAIAQCRVQDTKRTTIHHSDGLSKQKALNLGYL